MNRRSFFGKLVGAIVAAGVVLRSESLTGSVPSVAHGGCRLGKSMRLAMKILEKHGRIDFVGKPIVWEISGRRWVE